MTDNREVRMMKEKWEEQDRLQIEAVLSTLLSSAGGRKFLFYVLGLAKIGQNPFTPNALQMSFICGEQNVGQQLLSEILAVSPDGWVQMQKEATDNDRSRTDAIARAIANTSADSE